MKRPGITVVTPSIPVRTHLLARAVKSVFDQTIWKEIGWTPKLSIAVDSHKQGAAQTRQRALEKVNTEWTAFLDDDDEFKLEHLEKLLSHAINTQADYVYSWFDVVGGIDPFPPGHYEKPYDPVQPVATTITVLVRTEIAQAVGFNDDNRHETQGGEDWAFQMGCQNAGAKISHLVDRTWLWHHDSMNTSGLPSRW